MTIAAALRTSSGDRVRATPYARRLARERGVALAVLTGSGPGGRVTGADVMRLAAPIAPAPAVAAYVPAAALAAAADLTAARSLLQQFGQTAPRIELIDICLKAVAAARFGDGAIALSMGGGAAALALRGLDRLSLGAIADLRRRPAESAGGPLSLSLVWIERAGIRPVSMPLPGACEAELTIAGDATSESVECLFSYDGRKVDHAAAADFLLAFKAGVEIPLRLIA